MTEQEVVDLMSSSKSESEWNSNCDEVKRRCGGCPSFWFPAVVMSGLAKRVTESYGRSFGIKISTFGTPR